MVCAPVLALILFFVVNKVAPMYTRLQKAVDRLNNVVQEWLTGIRAVKAFVRGEYEEEKFQDVNQELMDTSQKTFHFAVLNLSLIHISVGIFCRARFLFGAEQIVKSLSQIAVLFFSEGRQVGFGGKPAVQNDLAVAHKALTPEDDQHDQQHRHNNIGKAEHGGELDSGNFQAVFQWGQKLRHNGEERRAQNGRCV